MTVQELKTSVAEGNIKNVYLFYGEEEYLIKMYISQIKNAVITNPALEDLNYSVFEKFNKDEFEDAVNTLPAFADKKLIVFNETGVFKDPGKADKEYLESAIPELGDHVTVIFRETAIDSRLKKLTGAVEKSGAIVKFDYMTEKQLKSWINVMTSKQGKRISIPNMEYLLSCVGTSMSAIENEVKKLCSFAEKEIISKEDIDDIVTKSLENRVFQLSDSIISKNTEKALQIINELRLLKEEPIKTAALVSKNLCDIYKVKTASPQNLTPQKLGMHPYAIKTNSKSSVSKNFISKLIHMLADTDEKMKSSPLDSWTLLEHFVTKASLV